MRSFVKRERISVVIRIIQAIDDCKGRGECLISEIMSDRAPSEPRQLRAVYALRTVRPKIKEFPALNLQAEHRYWRSKVSC